MFFKSKVAPYQPFLNSGSTAARWEKLVNSNRYPDATVLCMLLLVVSWPVLLPLLLVTRVPESLRLLDAAGFLFRKGCLAAAACFNFFLLLSYSAACSSGHFPSKYVMSHGGRHQLTLVSYIPGSGDVELAVQGCPLSDGGNLLGRHLAKVIHCK